MNVGDPVNYHKEIGGPVTSRGHTIEQIDTLVSGLKLVWISGRSMFVLEHQITEKTARSKSSYRRKR
jgi:hypothetical protein